MLYAIIWLVATVAMFVSGGVGIPLVVGLFAGIILSVVRNMRRGLELERLSKLYRDAYGVPAPGSPVRSTGVGYAVGSLLGSSAMGGLVGAAADLVRFASARSEMSEDQKRLHARIVGLRAWSPFLSFYVFGVSLGLTAGVAALLSAVVSR